MRDWRVPMEHKGNASSPEIPANKNNGAPSRATIYFNVSPDTKFPIPEFLKYLPCRRADIERNGISIDHLEGRRRLINSIFYHTRSNEIGSSVANFSVHSINKIRIILVQPPSKSTGYLTQI